MTVFIAFQRLFFAVFGQTTPDDINPLRGTRPEWTENLFKLVFGVYLLVSVIVLINLLIAMMSDTYQRIQVTVHGPRDCSVLMCLSVLFSRPTNRRIWTHLNANAPSLSCSCVCVLLSCLPARLPACLTNQPASESKRTVEIINPWLSRIVSCLVLSRPRSVCLSVCSSHESDNVVWAAVLCRVRSDDDRADASGQVCAVRAENATLLDRVSVQNCLWHLHVGVRGRAHQSPDCYDVWHVPTYSGN